MSRVAIACAFALAAMPCSAQEADTSRPVTGTSVGDAKPFLFDGLMKRDLIRHGTQADHRRRNSGVVVVEPETRQPARP
jgi:hypothetical protein